MEDEVKLKEAQELLAKHNAELAKKHSDAFHEEHNAVLKKYGVTLQIQQTIVVVPAQQ